MQAAEQVYKFAAKHRAEQSVCTSLHENAVTHSVLLGSKYVTKGGALNLKFKWDLAFCQLLIRAILRGLEHFSHGQSILQMTIGWYRAMIYRGNMQDVFMNQDCLFVLLFLVCFLFCVEGWCLPLTGNTDFTFTPLPSNGHYLCRPWFFARCANLAFLWTRKMFEIKAIIIGRNVTSKGWASK